MANPPKLLHSYPEAREMLGGVTESTFTRWIAEGIIKTVRIGRRKSFIPDSEIQRLAGLLPKEG